MIHALMRDDRVIHVKLTSIYKQTKKEANTPDSKLTPRQKKNNTFKVYIIINVLSTAAIVNNTHNVIMCDMVALLND